ncbi:hypothetical protein KJZ61_03015 [Candidatus Dependentiae bacterium]|nr:hypothetical protein [Candidatus Dependentiae bacterium]
MSFRLNGRLNGGEPIAGWCGYWGTKIVAYGALSLGISTAASLATSSAGTALGIKGAAAGAKGTVAGTKTVVTALKGLFGAKGVAVAAAEEGIKQTVVLAVGEAAAEKAIEETTKAVAFSFGGFLAYIPAVIETSATAVGAFLGASPLP